MSPTSSGKPAPRLSRRAFLTVLGSSGLLAALASCRAPWRLGSAPTPTPTRTPRPARTATGTAAPAGTGGPSPSPSASQVPITTPLPTGTSSASATAAATTATPTATATRVPPTPTPTATPFPPGPPSKLGLFVTRNDPRIFDLLRTKNVALVKTLEYDWNFALEIKQVSPKTLLVGRITLPQLHLTTMSDPAAAARQFADTLLPIAAEARRLSAFDAWEAYNEPTPGDAVEMARLAQFEAERTRLLAAAGVRSVIGNFATGFPDLALWPHFRPALEAAKAHGGYLGLHEYSAPTLQFGTPQDPLGWGRDPAQEGWLTLRYRKIYRGYLEPNGLALPLLLTEAGIDGMVGNRPGPQGRGWMDFGDYWDALGMGSDAAGNYMEQLAWYDAQLQADSYVLGAALFAAAASPGWESYEVLGNVEPFLKQYLSVHPVR